MTTKYDRMVTNLEGLLHIMFLDRFPPTYYALTNVIPMPPNLTD